MKSGHWEECLWGKKANFNQLLQPNFSSTYKCLTSNDTKVDSIVETAIQTDKTFGFYPRDDSRLGMGNKVVKRRRIKLRLRIMNKHPRSHQQTDKDMVAYKSLVIQNVKVHPQKRIDTRPHCTWQWRNLLFRIPPITPELGALLYILI